VSLPAAALLDATEWTRVEIAAKEILEYSVSLGGTLTGEHGFVITRKPFPRPFAFAIQHIPGGACPFISRVTEPK
jgi:FAD/FMN-containing dehydrogenase